MPTESHPAYSVDSRLPEPKMECLPGSVREALWPRRHSSAVDLGSGGGLPNDETTIYKVHKVELPGFGGDVATYDFEYSDEAIVPGCAWGDWDPDRSKVMPLLERVLLPPAAPGAEPLSWEISYYDNEPTNYTQCRQGLVESVTLPSGGKIEWDYKPLVIEPHCGDTSAIFFWSRTPAIKKRRYRDVDASILAEWSYVYRFSMPPVAGPQVCDQVAQDHACGNCNRKKSNKSVGNTNDSKTFKPKKPSPFVRDEALRRGIRLRGSVVLEVLNMIRAAASFSDARQDFIERNGRDPSVLEGLWLMIGREVLVQPPVN